MQERNIPLPTKSDTTSSKSYNKLENEQIKMEKYKVTSLTPNPPNPLARSPPK